MPAPDEPVSLEARVAFGEGPLDAEELDWLRAHPMGQAVGANQRVARLLATITTLQLEATLRSHLVDAQQAVIRTLRQQPPLDSPEASRATLWRLYETIADSMVYLHPDDRVIVTALARDDHCIFRCAGGGYDPDPDLPDFDGPYHHGANCPFTLLEDIQALREELARVQPPTP